MIAIDINELQKQKWMLFALYSLFAILFLFLINDIIITDPQYFTGGNENSVKLFRNVYFFIYLIYPIYALIKIAIIAGAIRLAAAAFFSLEIEFFKLFTLVLLAEFALLLPDLIESVWFLLIHTNYTMEEVKYFYPFSVYSLIGFENIEQTFDYPLKLINPFELFYWYILITGLKEITEKSTKQSFKIVLFSYGLLLLLIIIFRFIIYSTILTA
jgi:hypothetical protein